MTLPICAQVLRVLSLLLLLAYPAVLIANAMQAAALLDSSRRKEGSALQRTLMGVFVGGTTLYPLVVLASHVLANNAPDETRELAWSAGPLAFLGALAGLFAWLGKHENV